jgi:predicted ATP-grasp superfamily ATP-dependent carboligase
MQELVERDRIDVVFPVTDVTTHAVSLNQKTLLRSCAVAVPPFDAFDLVTNKKLLIERAAACGIPIPRTQVVTGLDALEDVADHLEYPIVAKPIRSRIAGQRGWQRATVHYAASAAGVRRLYENTPYLTSHPSLLQERIVGPGVGLFALFDHGEIVAAFAHERLREHPPSGGVSVHRRSVPLDPLLLNQAVRLLGPLGWHGVAMLEYKQDRRTGAHVLMEVNGRFWGSLQLAIDAGVDFPFLTYQLALGVRPGPSMSYRVGVKSRWLLGDLDHLLLRLCRRDRDLDLPDDAPSKVGALLAFLNFAERNVRYEVVDASDPRPFMHELRRYAEGLVASAGSRVRRPPVNRRPARTVEASARLGT